MPGGDLRAAIGVEYIREKYTGFNNRTITNAGILAAADRSVGRNIKAVFGEINLPIIGADNRGAIHGLSLTASGRYDDYSDFGHTFNPKIGINFEPVEWLRIRGNWGKAFQAPGLSDIFQATSPSVGALRDDLAAVLRPRHPGSRGRAQCIPHRFRRHETPAFAAKGEDLVGGLRYQAGRFQLRGRDDLL